jgi:hypothetical protein
VQLLKIILVSYGTGRFIIEPSSGSYPEPNQSIPYHPLSQGSSQCYLPTFILVFSGFPTHTLYASPPPGGSYIPCLSHHLILGEKSMRFETLPYAVFSVLLSHHLFCPNNFLSTLFSNTSSLSSSLNIRDKFHTHTEPQASYDFV